MVDMRIPRNVFALAVVVFLVFCAGCATSPPAPQVTVPTTAPVTTTPTSAGTTPPAATTSTFVSPAYGYTLTYPVAWAVREENGGATVTFTTPAESSSDSFRENLRVVVQDLTASPMDLDTFVASQLAIRKQGLANYNLIFESPLKIGTLNARKMAYTATLGSGRMQWVEIYTIRGLTAYSLSFTAEESHYRIFVEDLDKTLQSFTLT